MNTFDDRWTGTPPAGTERIAFQRMPGDAEALAAIANLHVQTVSPNLRLGMRVRVPRVYGDGDQEGTVAQLVEDRHLGTTWNVDTPQGRLKYLPSEITVVGW